ncbi:hypothetical protein CVU82_00380 [Candidatus Falkowbacteria bacterium HGW-Falkowbacteria-1]|jgi:hypothetical protein|uniref:Glycosyltransferase RgtA/B/C/D-like domain-containing protein n=1 Tax=Candidatus Falkowbacteria bacterium HGW-Falkowbacteria-1 TaxID=2013768 RepID=A0A2N2EAA7_9BACT|nr:MAG: hypothetical protein CVU82_00380 [Candidatus Falkowbacteria bacterium HGW-Falkowbacteria-1]
MNTLNGFKKKKVEFLILLIIILAGLFLRIYKLNEQSYWIDEGYTLNAVTATIKNGYPILDSGEVYSRSILNTYLISGPVMLFGFNETATRITSVVFGILTVYLIFLISKKIFNNYVAILASFMTSFSYWQIAWSRQARMYSQFQFFFFLSIYLFDSLLKKFSYRKLLFLSLSTLFAILSHYFGYLLIAIYGATILWRLSEDKNLRLKIYQEIKKRKILSFGFLVLFVPIIFKISRDLFYKMLYKHNYYLVNFLDFVRSFFPVIYILAILGFILACFYYKKKQQSNKLNSSIILAISFLLPFLIIAISSDRKVYRYITFLIPILFVFCSFFIYFISERTRQTKIVFVVLSSLVVILVMNLNIRVFNFVPESHYYLEPLTPQANFKQAYQAVKNDGFNDISLIISPYPVMDKIYLGKTDYCLAMNLAGGEIKEWQKTDRDYYTNATNIFDVETLEKITKENNGYIIIDYMAIDDRLSPEMIDFINKQKLIFKDDYKFNNQIWVFEF